MRQIKKKFRFVLYPISLVISSLAKGSDVVPVGNQFSVLQSIEPLSDPQWDAWDQMVENTSPRDLGFWSEVNYRIVIVYRVQTY
jgi:hypothetical protein